MYYMYPFNVYCILRGTYWYAEFHVEEIYDNLLLYTNTL